MTDLQAEEVIAESRKAIEVLLKLAARLEVFTDKIEQEIARREGEESGTDGDR